MMLAGIVGGVLVVVILIALFATAPPKIESTLSDFESAWQTNNQAEIGNLFHEDRRSRGYRSHKKLLARRGWTKTAPKLGEPSITPIGDDKSEVKYKIGKGQLVTIWRLTPEKEWCLLDIDAVGFAPIQGPESAAKRFITAYGQMPTRTAWSSSSQRSKKQKDGVSSLVHSTVRVGEITLPRLRSLKSMTPVLKDKESRSQLQINSSPVLGNSVAPNGRSSKSAFHDNSLCHRTQDLAQSAMNCSARMLNSAASVVRQAAPMSTNVFSNKKKQAKGRATPPGPLPPFFLAPFFGLVISAFLPLGDGYTWSRLICSIILDVAIGFSAAAFLKNGVAKSCLLLPSKNSDFGLAAGAALLTFAVSYAYVGLMNRIADNGQGAMLIPAHARVIFVVSAVVVAPLIEEWLCRGIMWDAMRRVAGPVGTVVVTSMLFAFLHILGGGWVLELPHRFIAGALFGVLRLKTNSLWPGVFAHFLNNLAAMFLMFG